VLTLLAAGNASQANVPEQERARWQSRFRYLLDELCTHRGDDGGIVYAVLKSFLLDIMQFIRPAGEVDVPSGRGVLEAVFQYIDAHYRSAITLRDVAAIVHFSPAYLTDLVRRETGRPIHQWISKRRLDAARSLLAETDRPIAEIAEDVGFRDPTYFGRYFSKTTGQTPRAWREAHRGRGLHSTESGPIWHREITQGALGDYAILRSLAETCGALTDREEIESAVVDATHELFRPSLVQVLQRNETLGLSAISCQRGAHLSVALPPARDNEGALPLVLIGQTVVAHDLPRSSIELFQRMGKLGVCCFIVAPIMAGSQCVGAIRILETQLRAFSEQERARLAMIGALAGLALRGALRQR
jgi:AraC-like DNA-binding protein